MASMTENPTTAAAGLRDLRDAVDAYRTCELATMSRSGVPITWPAVCTVSPAADRIILTTSISFPQKAFNIRRDPRVALLFSDPTGTGRTDLPQILVRGTATCPQEIHTGTQGMTEYWRRLAGRQPSSRGYVANALGRWLFDWYYMRLVITVTPLEVIRTPRDAPAGPMTAPRIGRSEDGAFARLCRELPGFSSAVLATAAVDEPPVLRRVRLHADRSAGGFMIQGGRDLAAGPASLLLHRHDDLLSNQRQLGVLGALAKPEDRWLFRPDRLLPNMFPDNPIEMMRTLYRARGSAARYLERRGLERPAIDWAAHRACEVAA